MALQLILNQPQVSVGLSTFTCTIPSTGIYNVICQATMPTAVAEGSGSGSASDNGLGAKGGFPGDGSNAKNALVAGNTGLGCLGTNTDGASPIVQGHGAGAGGGFAGFVGGAFGPGFGGVGQGFGPGDGYAHSLADVKTPTTIAPVTSALSILVKKNGVTVYTAPTPGVSQGMVEFKKTIACSANDVITIVPSSTSAADGVAKMTVAVNQGI